MIVLFLSALLSASGHRSVSASFTVSVTVARRATLPSGVVLAFPPSANAPEPRVSEKGIVF